MSIEAALPPDVNPITRSRLPPVDPNTLDGESRKLYDAAANDPNSIVGLAGPAGIRLHNPKYYAFSRPANRYLRFEAGLDPKHREVAILATAREISQRFEWNAHETEGRHIGLDPALVDLIRFRRPLDGLADPEAAIIQLAREAFGERRVRPETFARARALFPLEYFLNLTELMASYAATGAILTIFDQHVPPGTEVNLPPL
jgi:4-carboxymuconolactone decarboxylase